MAFKKKSKDGEGNQPSEPSKSPKQPEPSSFQEPIKIALAMDRRPGGWALVTIHYQGDKVVKTDYSAVDNKAVIHERFRLAAAKNFLMPSDMKSRG